MNTPVAMAASGSGSSTTSSAISGGTIVIRDEAGQQALTGKTAAETIASLNRDTSDTLNALKPIFDKEKIEAGFEIVSEASRQTGSFGESGCGSRCAREGFKDGDRSCSQAATRRAAQEAARWLPGGDYRLGLTALTLAAGGNVTGGTGEFLRAAAVNYLQGLGAAQIKELSKPLGGDGSPANIALHAILGCAGAAARDTSCGAGAAGASAGIVISELINRATGKGSEKLSAEEREAQVNLVTSVLAGLTASLDPAALAAINNASRLELENNHLTAAEHHSRTLESNACGKIQSAEMR